MTINIVSEPEVPMYQLAAWAIEKLRDTGDDITHVNDLGHYRAFGVVKDDKLVAVFIYNWFRELPYGNDCRVIMCAESPEWCLPGVVRAILSYPFMSLGCERITAVIKDGNERSLKLALGVGFRKEGTLRRAFNGRTNAIVLGMLKHECRWLPENVKKGRWGESPKSSEHQSDDKPAVAGEQSRHAGKRKTKRGKPVRSERVDDVRV